MQYIKICIVENNKYESAIYLNNSYISHEFSILSYLYFLLWLCKKQDHLKIQAKIFTESLLYRQAWNKLIWKQQI